MPVGTFSATISIHSGTVFIRYNKVFIHSGKIFTHSKKVFIRLDKVFIYSDKACLYHHCKPLILAAYSATVRVSLTELTAASLAIVPACLTSIFPLAKLYS